MEISFQAIVLKRITDYMNCRREGIPTGIRLDALGIHSPSAITMPCELEDKQDFEVPDETYDFLLSIGDLLNRYAHNITRKNPV